MAYHYYQGADRVLYEVAWSGRAVGSLFGPPGMPFDEVKRQIAENHDSAPTVSLDHGELPFERANKIALSDELRVYARGRTRIQ